MFFVFFFFGFQIYFLSFVVLITLIFNYAKITFC